MGQRPAALEGLRPGKEPSVTVLGSTGIEIQQVWDGLAKDTVAVMVWLAPPFPPLDGKVTGRYRVIWIFGAHGTLHPLSARSARSGGSVAAASRR